MERLPKLQHFSFLPYSHKFSCRHTTSNPTFQKSLKAAFRGGFKDGLGVMRGGRGNGLVKNWNGVARIERI